MNVLLISGWSGWRTEEWQGCNPAVKWGTEQAQTTWCGVQTALWKLCVPDHTLLAPAEATTCQTDMDWRVCRSFWKIGTVRVIYHRLAASESTAKGSVRCDLTEGGKKVKFVNNEMRLLSTCEQSAPMSVWLRTSLINGSPLSHPFLLYEWSRSTWAPPPQRYNTVGMHINFSGFSLSFWPVQSNVRSHCVRAHSLKPLSTWVAAREAVNVHPSDCSKQQQTCFLQSC